MARQDAKPQRKPIRKNFFAPLRLGVRIGFCFALLLCQAVSTPAQTFEMRGFVETTGVFYPQTAPGDSGQAVGNGRVQYEAFWRPLSSLRFAGGIDAETDSHLQVERTAHLSWWDRERQRPAFAVRRLSLAWDHDRLSVELGKQFIRWGKADVLNPTDRFAPRDFLNVVDNEFLAVWATRLTYGTQSNTVDLVWAPRFTPSRIPLLGQRWAPVPAGVPVTETEPSFPGGQQVGARWNHIGKFAEYSFSFYQGYSNLPVLPVTVRPQPLSIELQRQYPQMRMYGGDIAVPLKWVTLKGEAGYFTSTSRQADEYALYVVQMERQAGEWFFIGGYSGEVVTDRRALLYFSPERGFARALLGRAGYTIDTNRSVALETVVRQDGKGLWVKLEYTQAFGQHWRLIGGYALIRGSDGDFLGQYRHNSHLILVLRYSF